MNNGYFTEAARQIPIVETDVFIAGAGTAGCIAAIAAARAGAKVTLVEKLPVPGGTLTNGGIGVSSFFSQNADPAQAKRIVDGLPYELIDTLIKRGGATLFRPTPNNEQLNPYRVVADHEPYKGVISEMLMEAGVNVLLNTMLSDVVTEDGRIQYVIVQNRNGRTAYKAASYIDTTGDGDLAKLAGAKQFDMTHGKECATGMVFGISGVDIDRALAENPKGFHVMGSGEVSEAGVTNRQFIFITMMDPERYGKMESLKGLKMLIMQSNHENDATYVNLSRGEIIDGTDVAELSAAELRMRARLPHIVEDFRKYVPGFEHAYLSWCSTQLGVRVSYITECDYSITQEDIHSARRFDDEIGLYAFHDLPAKAGDNIPITGAGFYGFPYRMLLPKGIDNLYIAGRCVTEEYEAHMSTRNTVGCMIMGQAAGAAAALCASGGCMTRELPYEVLKKELLKQKVILDVQ